MSIVDANYTVQKSISHGFMGGFLATWMADNSTGGGSVTAESTGGGLALLSTGTTAVDDRGRIDIGPLSPAGQSGLDAVGVRCVFALDSGAQSSGDAVVQFGWLDDNVPNRVYHQPNHDSSNISTLRISSGTDDTTLPTRACQPADAITTELLWDTTADEIIHRYQGAYAQRVTSDDATIPDASTDHTFKIQIGTKDTSSDRTMSLYGVEIAYYNRDRQ